MLKKWSFCAVTRTEATFSNSFVKETELFLRFKEYCNSQINPVLIKHPNYFLRLKEDQSEFFLDFMPPYFY